MPASVLLVDDERFARTLYADYLRVAGFEVEVTEGAESALALLRDRSFDVLVTDIVMPRGDGLQLLSDAKLADPDMQVVVITALDKVDPAVRAMKSGASDYLVKPVTPEALQMAVQRSLATRALLAENQALRSHLNLFETCQRILATPDRDKLVALALSSLAAECRAAAAMLLEHGPGGWSIAGMHGLDRPQAESLLDASRAALGGLAPGTPAVVDAPAAGPPIPHGRAACLPVSDGEKVLGAACLLLPEDLDFERAGRAAFMCRHLAVALQALGRLSQAQNLVYLDDLTHLYNTRFLDLVLEREIHGARPFSVLFLDIDHFKEVNDRHGHIVGSKLLVEVGRVLRSCVRDDDVLVRYGGDEFVAVLVGIDSGAGIKVAERIRRAIEDHRFLSREGGSVRVTASIGLASFPEHAEGKADVLDLADRAMYRGKRTTRNVVYMASHDLPPVTGR